MHSGIWLAYAAISGLAFSATLSEASQSEDDLTTPPLKQISPGNVSAATTKASHLNDFPNLNLFSLNNTSQRTSNHSTSLYDLPLGYDFPAVANAVPECNGATYGTNLDRHSCFDAWRSMEFSSQRVSWGPRDPGHNFQYRLPYRWSSEDGQCVIDVVHHQDRNSDFASFLEIRNAAEQVMKKCIDPVNNPAEGGFVANVGKGRRLVVVVSKYTPDVVCGQTFQAPDHPPLCRDTLSALPVSLQTAEFGPKGSPGVKWPLPWTYQASGSGCAATVRIKNAAHQETIRWFDIWAAAVAVDAICIKQKRLGVSGGLGDHKYGAVTLQNRGQAPVPPPLALVDE